MKLTHLSLFSGIGGIDLAAEWAGFETVAFCEKDPFCQKVLAKHWPGVPIYDDVQNVNGKGPWGRLSLLSAGFPCQPFSDAGERGGTGDSRWLWGHIERLLLDTGAEWFVGENVQGLLTIDRGRTFGYILRRLGEIGYRVGWSVHGACDFGAPHERDRVFIVAVAEGQRWATAKPCEAQEHHESLREARANWDDIRAAFAGNRAALLKWGIDRPAWFLRGHDGVPPGLDRLRALGNAVVPQQVFPILEAIAAEIRASRMPQDLMEATA